MSRFLVRVLERVEGVTPTRMLAALPVGSCPVLLDSSDGLGACLLAWSPDRHLSGRLQPQASDQPLASVDPAMELQRATADEHWSADDPGLPLWGGWIGYFGFECGHAWEAYPWLPPDPAGFEDYHFGRYRGSVLFQNDGQVLLLWAENLDVPGEIRRQERSQLRAEFAQLLDRTRASSTTKELAFGEADETAEPVTLRPVISPQQYCQAVKKLRQWIGAGELYQANLSHRLVGPAPSNPRAFYAEHRSRQPTSMSAYWEDHAGRVLMSWSPERFLRVRGEHLETRPIKGTAPRQRDPLRDQLAATELEASAKERAELTMIVDMARNDLGRVAHAGQVQVETVGQVEAFPTLFHRTAVVRAHWNPAQGVGALLRATLPPASVTGAPKVRALRAIAELEDTARGPYCGAFGYWLPGQPRADFSVLIRTATHQNGQLSLRVGAGIVWDSQPEHEWHETLVKARYLTQQYEQASL
jgi:para-aminobenzoate synthetase component I